MKRNLLTLTMLVLCLMISITLAAVPASANGGPPTCVGIQEVIIYDLPYVELTVKCDGSRTWNMPIIDAAPISEDTVIVVYAVGFGIIEEQDEFIGEFSGTISNILGKLENKLETRDGDTLEIEFKLKQPADE